MARFAWVTLATNDSYSLGALVLAHSLRQVNTAYELVVLITPGVTEAMKTQLSAVFNVVKLVDVLDSKDTDNLALLARPELGITFTKLHCWKLTEFEKCVFLDADTLVVQNSDELFEREELSAAPDAGWPDCFNSGVFVFKPSKETFQALIEFALIHGSFDGGDQGLLNLFFSDWATKDIKKHLPFVYNMCSTATYSYLPAFKQFGAGLKIIHFIGAAKPWLQPFNTETGLASVSSTSQHLVQFVQLWWDIFCAHVHPSLSTEMAGLAGALATVTLGTPLTAEQRALEEHLRRQGWEEGNIDYMGKDSFANIWQKICETLASGTQQSAPSAPPEEARAPVAPVAAPVYVSSVEISPSGQIDKSPPQANYAPVSALEPTVETSDAKDANKAPSSEAATVTSEPKSSFTEMSPLEPSATVLPPADIPAAATQFTSASPLPSQAVESTTVPVSVPTVPSEKFSPSTPIVVSSSNENVATSPEPVVSESSKTEVISPVTPPLTSPPEKSSLVSEVTSADLVPMESSEITDTPSTVATSKKTADSQQFSTPSIPASKDSQILTPPQTEAPMVAPVLTESQLLTTSPSALVETALSTESTTSPSAQKQIPEITPIVPTSPPPTSTASPDSIVTTAATGIAVSTSASTETSVSSSGPAETLILHPDPEKTSVLSSTPTETQISTPIQTELSPASSVSTKTPTSITPVLTPSAPAPTDSTVVTSSDTTPISIETQSSIPLVLPSTPTTTSVPVATPGYVVTNIVAPTAELASECISSVLPVEGTKATSIQPQTPTVTEPTPPTSPPVATEAPQLTNLQIESEVPGTPPVGSSTQPSLAETSGNEPPVPPKRKGGSKAPQDSKNQKGGKPTKGKK